MKPGRNEPCSCGSREKFKRCCGKGVPALDQERVSPAPLIDATRLAAMMQAGRYRDVERATQELLDRYPTIGYLWKFRGLAQRCLGTDARQALYWATRHAPDDSEAHCHLGYALLDVAQSQAEPCFRRAVELKPAFGEAHAGLSRILKLVGRVGEAETSCRRALELHPGDAGSHALMGDIQADQGRFADAEASFNRARDIDPSLADAWVGIARYRKMSSTDESWLRSVQDLLGRSPPPRQEAALRFAVGKYHDDLGDFASAFGCYRRANELSRARQPCL